MADFMYSVMGRDGEVNGKLASFFAGIFPSYADYREAELKNLERVKSNSEIMQLLSEGVVSEDDLIAALKKVKETGFISPSQYSGGEEYLRSRACVGDVLQSTLNAIVRLNYTKAMDYLLSDKDGKLTVVAKYVFNDRGASYEVSGLEGYGKDILTCAVLEKGSPDMLKVLTKYSSGISFGNEKVEFGKGTNTIEFLTLALKNKKHPGMAQALINETIKSADENGRSIADNVHNALLIAAKFRNADALKLLFDNFGENGTHAVNFQVKQKLVDEVLDVARFYTTYTDKADFLEVILAQNPSAKAKNEAFCAVFWDEHSDWTSLRNPPSVEFVRKMIESGDVDVVAAKRNFIACVETNPSILQTDEQRRYKDDSAPQKKANLAAIAELFGYEKEAFLKEFTPKTQVEKLANQAATTEAAQVRA